MQYRIVEWDRRYEVADDNRPYTPGKKKRKGSLRWVRLSVFGEKWGKGWRALRRRVGKRRMAQVFGIFAKALEFAAQADAGKRGFIPDPEKFAADSGLPVDQVEFAYSAMIDLGWVEQGDFSSDSAGSCGFQQKPALTNQPTRPDQTRPTACARASGDGSVSEPEAVRNPPPASEPGFSPWALTRQAVSTAFGKDPGIDAALSSIANSLLSDRPGLDQAAGTIRELVAEAMAKGDKPRAYFMGALHKRWGCTRQKGGKPDAVGLHGELAKTAGRKRHEPN